ncbi:MAG: hypothetical protein JXO48_03080 [Deltaproteobacteria bacterium]|nr:hypothetical protein [Deltaproteobacteria bacterium]
MNSFERIDAVLALEQPDRVPLSPILDHWAATFTGISNAVLMSDPEERINAVIRTATSHRWDMTYLADLVNTPLLQVGVPARLLFPGRDLPADAAHQFDERGFMEDADYDILVSEGIYPFIEAIATRIYPEMTLESALISLDSAGRHGVEAAARVCEAGIVPESGFILPGPSYEYFSLARGLERAMADLRERPGVMKEAGRRYCRDMVELAMNAVDQIGIRRVFIGLSRSAASFLSAPLFEEMVLPDLEYLVRSLLDAGIMPILHCDCDWTPFLHYFRRFPRARCFIELDGCTDIFEAKNILGDTMAIKGDVPAELTALGSAEEVRRYCRRLIESVGAGGGFILSSGCSLPANAKSGNVMAMTEAVEKWGRYE